ncbi:MAG: UDP-N-acetylmuramoyl-L-alanyl-D-glutamate--2,6-diaminopimelate ligase [Planctomycetota bacterium]|nr:UDP-N-acetylmuramoyl-L-alanyl-D-glutamate--2,6-diaminopimelate ligase [Planctomycetota bacterium]
MRLSVLLEGIQVRDVLLFRDLEVRGVAYDSRKVEEGFLFAALPGHKVDGTKFVPDARAKNAAAIITEVSTPLSDLPQIVVDDARLALAQVANKFYGNPSAGMKMAGVTGTNGKTTTAYLIRHIMRKAGIPCGLLSTIEYDLGDEVLESAMTTPESLDICRYLYRMKINGCKACSMEVSSHSLVQHRVEGIGFSAAVFTNLTQDHLDYHKTMDEYRRAKGLLFEKLSPDATAILNDDDEASVEYAGKTKAKIWRYSVSHGMADWVGRVRSMDMHGTRFDIYGPFGHAEVRWKLLGMHNVENALGAMAACVSMGVGFEEAAYALESFQGAPGRLEAVPGTGGFRVLVDYAHTDDALRRILTALRNLQPKRVITVFGCGGDRDRGKRPKMGRVVEEMSDIAIVTSDNPRSEDPKAIIDDILAGMKNPGKAIVEADRREAIARALAEAREGDIVLIAGKGHEKYQIIKDQKRYFDDRQEAARMLRDSTVHASAAGG